MSTAFAARSTAAVRVSGASLRGHREGDRRGLAPDGARPPEGRERQSTAAMVLSSWYLQRSKLYLLPRQVFCIYVRPGVRRSALIASTWRRAHISTLSILGPTTQEDDLVGHYFVAKPRLAVVAGP